jgi:hypothetical protein
MNHSTHCPQTAGARSAADIRVRELEVAANKVRAPLGRAIRRAISGLCALALSACSLFSGSREVPASAQARRLLDESSGWSAPVNLVHRDDSQDITFFVAFDGTLNDRKYVPKGEDATVIAKLFEYVAAPETGMADAQLGRIAKTYHKGPGCQFGLACWLDAATGNSSARTASLAFDELRAFTARRSPDINLNVVVVGFSRGAATARHFLNLVNGATESGFLRNAGLRARSYAVLFDTVATGDAGALDLSIPANVELAIHYVAKNESRPLFAPVIDRDPVFEAAAWKQVSPITRRIWTFLVPGAHSDLGDSYRRGVGPVMTAHATAVLARMGLGAPVSKNLCPSYAKAGQRGDECRTLDEGLHDSRGILDRIRGVGSPYACGFERQAAKVELARISESEADRLATRIRQQLFPMDAKLGPGSSITTSGSDSYVFHAKAGATKWPVLEPKLGGFVGHDAVVTYDGEQVLLELTDPINKGSKVPVPPSAIRELQRRNAPVELEMHLAKPGGPWWFVDGCLPNG